MASDPQLITLACAQPALKVVALRGQVAPSPTGGFGGWDRIARPLRKAATQWAGGDPFEQQFSLMLDGVRDEISVEDDCLALERMATPPSEGAEPPIVTVTGAVLHPELAYVVSALDWDAGPLWSRRGYRIRHEVTLTLLEHVAGGQVAATAAAQARAAATGDTARKSRSAGSARQAPQSKIYVVKAGDTLSRIAATLLGSYKRWREIADLNGIRDPNAISVGQRLRLP